MKQQTSPIEIKAALLKSHDSLSLESPRAEIEALTDAEIARAVKQAIELNLDSKHVCSVLAHDIALLEREDLIFLAETKLPVYVFLDSGSVYEYESLAEFKDDYESRDFEKALIVFGDEELASYAEIELPQHTKAYINRRNYAQDERR
jgi:hypothetical protein